MKQQNLLRGELATAATAALLPAGTPAQATPPGPGVRGKIIL